MKNLGMAHQCHRPISAFLLRGSVRVARKFKMARIRNSEWQEDEQLRNDLACYVRQNLRKSKILDFIKTMYPHYAWSIRTLARRLEYFEIKFTDYDVDVEEVERVVRQEMEGPGRLLGYRALHKKVREIHGLNVPRNLVYDVMYEVNPQGLEERGGVGQPKRPRRTATFISSVSKYILIVMEKSPAYSNLSQNSCTLTTMAVLYLIKINCPKVPKKSISK